MKSKAFIKQQIKEILMERKDYSEARADLWLERNADKTVYELLTIKKELSGVEKEFRDVSWRSSIWNEENDD